MTTTGKPGQETMPRLLFVWLCPLAIAQSFEPPSSGLLPANEVTRRPAVSADFDGDGDIDVFAERLFYIGQLHRNDGEGRFVPELAPALLILSSYYSVSYAAGDIDADGDVDVVVGTQGQGGQCGANNLILRNDGMGAFTVQPLTSALDQTQHVLLVDIDGDADLDVVCSNWGSSLWCSIQSVSVLRNNGSGVFANVTTTALPGGLMQQWRSVALDVQGDGFVDLVFEGSALSVWVGYGTGIYSPAPGLLPWSLTNLRCADLDGDGDRDLFGIENGAVRFLRNDGAGVFTPYGGPAAPAGAYLVEAGDVDGDGDLDVVVGFGSYPAPPATRQWRHDAGFVFTDVTATHLPSAAGSPASVLFLDCDNDGDLDAFLNQHGLLLNDGTGRLLRLEPWPIGATRHGQAVDLDGDSHLDVVGFAPAGQYATLAWWRNDGAGQLPFAGTI
ncbi:MAG: VCBS repeat-containing protein, partial [Planctomycetota bacterium]